MGVLLFQYATPAATHSRSLSPLYESSIDVPSEGTQHPFDTTISGREQSTQPPDDDAELPVSSVQVIEEENLNGTDVSTSEKSRMVASSRGTAPASEDFDLQDDVKFNKGSEESNQNSSAELIEASTGPVGPEVCKVLSILDKIFGNILHFLDYITPSFPYLIAVPALSPASCYVEIEYCDDGFNHSSHGANMRCSRVGLCFTPRWRVAYEKQVEQRCIKK